MTTQPSETAAHSEQPTPDASPNAADKPTAAEESETDAPSFGWNDYAERLNGRFAMIGFAALLITQLFTRQDFWSWIGL